MSAKIETDLGGIHSCNGDEADDRTDGRPHYAQQKTFDYKNSQYSCGQGADSCNGADFIDALVNGHDHHIHDADQHDGNQHDPYEKGHQIDHLGDIKKGRKFKYLVGISIS